MTACGLPRLAAGRTLGALDLVPEATFDGLLVYRLGERLFTDGVLEQEDGSLNAWFRDSEGNALASAEDMTQPLS